MIDTKELRIGNYVWDDYSGEMMVSSIDFDNYVDLCKALNMAKGGYPTTNINPIELTPEWLERMGFIKKFEGRYLIGHQDFTYHLTHRSLHGFKDGGYFMGIRFDDYDTDPHTVYNFEASDGNVKYVHQLQNLYFALTRTELIVSP